MTNNFLFNIKTFTKLSYQDLKNLNYIKLVDGLWYRHSDVNNKAKSELDIVVNFTLSYEVKEDDLQVHQILLQELSALSGQKSNLSILIARIKEKGKLLKELLDTYKDSLEEIIVDKERSAIHKSLDEARGQFSKTNQLYNDTKIELRDVGEHLSLLYKGLKGNRENEEYITEMNNLKKRQSSLSINENQYKIDLEVLKDEITYYSKSLRKPLTNVDIDRRIQKDKEYRILLSQLHDLASILEYVEKLDNSQNEKSLVIRAIKSVVLADFDNDKKTIKFGK